jgi:hypothetical protein
MLEASSQDPDHVLAPLFAVLDGAVVPYAELIEASRKLAAGLVKQGNSMILSFDEDSRGVWDLEQLTDREAVAFGLWAALRLQTHPTSSGGSTQVDAP